MDGLRPEPPLTVSEWADKHRRLSSKAQGTKREAMEHFFQTP